MEKLKETLETLTKIANESSNNGLLTKVGEVKGLLLAFEMVNNSELLVKIINSLCEVTMMSLDTSNANITKVSNIQKATNNRFNKEGELAQFYIFLTNNGKKETTADVYRKTINQIIKESNLESLEDFEVNLNGILKVYTEKDLNEELNDNGRRLSAIKQYQNFIGVKDMEERKMYTKEQLQLIEEYENYLLEQRYAESSIKMYSRRIKNFFKNGYSVEDLKGSLDKLINDYSNGGSKFDPKDHNNTSSALKRLADYLG